MSFEILGMFAPDARSWHIFVAFWALSLRCRGIPFGFGVFMWLIELVLAESPCSRVILLVAGGEFQSEVEQNTSEILVGFSIIAPDP